MKRPQQRDAAPTTARSILPVLILAALLSCYGQSSVGQEDRVVFDWDAGALIGKKVFLTAVGLHPGHWGYIALDDVRVQGRLDPEATKARFARRERPRTEEARQALIGTMVAQGKPLRAAIEHLTATFGDRYPNGPEFLVQLDQLLQRAAGATPDCLRWTPTDRTSGSLAATRSSRATAA